MKFYLFLFLLPLSLFAAQVPDNGIHMDSISIRAMGMGNAFSAVADDYNLIHFNPAGFGIIKKSELVITPMRAGGTLGEDSFSQFYSDVTGSFSISDKDERMETLSAQLAKRYGHHLSARLTAISVSYVSPGWGLIFTPIDLSIDMSIHQQIGPTIDARAYQDSNFTFGYGTKIKAIDGLSVGTNIKFLHRIMFEKSLAAVTMATNKKFANSTDAKEGVTADMDLGFLYQLKKWDIFTPRVSFVTRNLLSYGFFDNFHLLDDASVRPEKLHRKFDVGTLVEIDYFKSLDAILTCDIRDMAAPNWSIRKGLHVGSEFGWRPKNWFELSIRAGVNQAYLTGGFTIRALWNLFEFVTYGEELGTSSAKEENRVYMGKYTLIF